EHRDGFRRDVDPDGRLAGALGRGGNGEEEERKKDRAVARMERERNPGPWVPHSATLHAGYGSSTRTQCSRRAGARCGSAGGGSSKSSASFSVIAPPSSSASTIVTARR